MNDQLPDCSTVTILGGTGPEGQGLGVRWARSGLRVILGSRDENRAHLAAQELAERSGGEVVGMENSAAVAAADVVVLAVPFDAQVAMLKHVAGSFRKGAVLICTVVPLAAAIHDRSSRLLGVWQGSAAELAAELVPSHVTVAGAFHNVAASLAEQHRPGRLRRDRLLRRRSRAPGVLRTGGPHSRGSPGQRGKVGEFPHCRGGDGSARRHQYPIQGSYRGHPRDRSAR